MIMTFRLTFSIDLYCIGQRSKGQEATIISLKLLLNLNVQGAPKTFPLKLGLSFKPGFRPKLIRSFGLILDFVFRLRFGFRLTRLIPKTK